MKKVLAWVLLLTLVLGLFAGCRRNKPEVTEPQPTTPVAEAATADDAIEYLKASYKDNGATTGVDYKRFGVVRVNGVKFNVVWTVDVGEDLIKIVPNDDGTVTIDINEECEADTPYTLTATITDANGNTATYSWEYILPKGQDMVEIVKAAYALQPGESLPYEARLIGKIISIDTIWNEDYQNITVTIEVTGAEGMPIKCYRMKAGDETKDQIKNLLVGNIITVRGIIKNYEGTIEFDAGCILEKVEKGDAIEAPTDPGEILAAAYKLAEGKALPYQATLTGTVIEIDSPYDPGYGNISVVIEVEGYPQYPILCYRLKGTGVDQIAVKDLITVTGIIKNYKGTIEYDAGCIMTERVSGGGVAQGPSSDAVKILADAAKLNPGEKLPYRATLTGTIYSVDTPYSSEYGNVTVTMVVNGVRIQCYRMVGDGASLIRETDTITVSGIIENYNGKLEFGAKCNLDSWSKGPRNVNYGPLSEGVAYKMYLNQAGIGKTIYFNGKVSGSRLSSTTNGAKGADVFAEKVAGKGLRLYYMDGNTKTYLEMEEYLNDKGQYRGSAKVSTTPSVYWVYDSYMGIYVVNLPNAGKYFLGTYSTYETFSASWIGYVDGTIASSSPQYIAKFIKSSEVSEEAPSDTVVQGTPVENPQVGTGYKFGFQQNQLDGKPFLGFNGKMAATYYFGTAEAIADMVDVYLEETDDGYYIYTKSGSTKKYLDIVPRDNDPTKVNVVMQTSGNHTVYLLNNEYKYVYATVAGSEWYLGTYGQNSSISASKTSYISDKSTIGVSQFCAWFSTVEEVEVEEPEVTEPEATEPAYPSVEAEIVKDPQAATAYKLGMDKGDGKVLYFTGNTESASVTYRLETSPDATKAVDVYLEAADGGYYLYFLKNGVKTYIRVFHRTDGDPGYGKGSLEFVTSAPKEVYIYDETANTLFYDYDGNNAYYMGTYGTYTTVSVSNTSYITGDKASSVDVSQFPVRFYTIGEIIEPEVTEPQPTQPSVPGADAEIVDDPVVETAYKLGMDKKDGKILYFTGNTESASVTYRLETSNDVSKAVDVYLESADGGYRLYFLKDGVKTYIRVYHRTDGDPGYGKGSLEYVTSTPNEVFTYDETAKTLIYDYDGNNAYYMGTYGTFSTISVSNTFYITGNNAGNVDVSQFPVRFYTVAESEDPDVTEPDVTEPDVTEPSTPGADAEIVDDPVVETAYKLGMDKKDGKILYFTGNTESASVTYRLETSNDVSKAVDVYLESADGGYRLYFLKDGVKTYIRVYHRTDGDPGYGKGSLEYVTSTPNEVFTYDETAKTLIYDYDGNNAYYMGTYGTFSTISVSNTFYITGNNAGNVDVSQFPVRFYTVAESEEPQPTEPEVTEPDVTEPPVSGDGFVKVTSADQLTSGKYVMIVSTGYAPGVLDSGWLSAMQPAVSGNTVTDDAGAVWTLTVNGSSVTLTDPNGVTVAPKGGNSNGVIEGEYNWAWSFNNGTFRFAGVDDDTVILASNATTTGQYPGNHRFRGYKTSTVASQAANYPCDFTLYKQGGEYVEPEVTEPEATEPSTPGVSSDVVTNPVAGTAYKLGMDKKDGKILYFTGNTESASVTYRLETSDDVFKAVDVYLEAADAGYRLYFMDDSGAKTYIRVYHRTDGDPGYGKGSLEFVTSVPNEVFTYDETANTLIYDYDGNNAYYMGTYGTFSTISVSNTSFITGDKAGNVDISQFPARFYAVGESEEPEATEPEATEPEVTEPAVEPGVVASPVAGTAYKLGMDKQDGKVLYFTGNTESASVTYRLETSTDASKAVDVYLEAADGGYRLYFMKDGTKTYIRVYHRTDGDPGYGKGSLEFVTSVPNEVFTYDETAKTLIFDYDGNNAYYMGTYGSFSTFSVSNTYYITGDKASTVDVSQFPARFYTVAESENPQPTEPEATEPEATEPSAPSVSADVVADPRAGVAYKMGMDKKDGKVLYFTGNTESASVTYRLETTTDVSKAVDVFLEDNNKNGYALYFMKDGVKTYIRVYHRTDGDPGYGKGSLEFVTSAPSEVFTFDKAACTLIYDYDGNNAYYMGTYGTFSTFSVSNTYYITGDKASTVDVSQFPARFYTVSESEEPEATEPEATEPEATEPSTGASEVTYTFSNYGPGTQYTTGETYDLDKITSLYLVGGHMNTQLRLYDDAEGDAQAIFTCANVIDSVVINAGHRAATLNVYASVDGENWVLIEAVATERITVVSDYPSYTVKMPAGTSYKYLKLDAVGAQIRVPYMVFTFKA